MNIRTPDPFPWPDDELCAEFGRTSYYAHKLERELKLFLLAAHTLKRIHIPFDATEHPSLETFLYRRTLGDLIHILKKGGGLTDKKLSKGLFAALKARNFLAHAALENHDPMHYRMEDRQSLLKRLQELRLKIGVPFLLVREFRKMCEEEIGVTEEQLQARLMCGTQGE